MIQVEITPAPKSIPKVKYPYIGKHITTGRLVLFIRHRVGLQLSNYDDDENVSYFYTDWNEADYTPFDGSVTLSNET